jgi:cyclic pyranopterin phosphate synthase
MTSRDDACSHAAPTGVLSGSAVTSHRSLPLYDATSAPPPRSVRISLTDRCDLACLYCRPSRSEHYLEERLDDDALRAMIAGLVKAGVRRIRLTGGEPLLHPRVVEIVGYIARLGVQDLALTTNATRLSDLARPLRDAGLSRLTVSIDTLDALRFARITRGGDLSKVLSGIEAAMAAGFDELKINCVVLRGENDDEIEALARFAWERGITPRFIEVMPIAEGAKWVPGHLVTAAEMRDKIAHLLEPEGATVDPDRGPAKYVRARHDHRFRVGFITGTSETFCGSCDRLRMAADGVLRPCLATDVGVSASQYARAGDAEGIVGAIAEAWLLKPDGATWRGCTEPTAAEVSMRGIGG